MSEEIVHDQNSFSKIIYHSDKITNKIVDHKET